jgi:acyl carrier protein phosphodiesterase
LNFLAHIYLSGNSEQIMLGNFIADSVKGKNFEGYDAEIVAGILLHRKIDQYTDMHPIVDQSKKRFRPNYHKYAPVIVDVLYDHYLASNWKNYSDIPLQIFAADIYQKVKKNEILLPEKSRLFMHYMIKNDILNAYSQLNGIQKVLDGMSKRTSFESNMNLALREINQYYDLFQTEFESFFPQICDFVQNQK